MPAALGEALQGRDELPHGPRCLQPPLGLAMVPLRVKKPLLRSPCLWDKATCDLSVW